MRVFTRESNESLLIDGDIRVTVLEVGEDFVVLGITHGGDDLAPSIDYDEVLRVETGHLEPVLS